MNELIFHKLNSLLGLSYFSDKLIYFLSNDFGYFLIIFSILFLIFHDSETNRQRIKESLIFAFSVFCSFVLVLILKDLFVNPRPFLIYPNIKTLFIYGYNESFPSGHAAFYGAMAAAIFIYHKKVGFWFICGAVLIGLARVVSGVHFPLDILFGFIFGACVSILTYALVSFLAKKYKKQIDFFFDKV